VDGLWVHGLLITSTVLGVLALSLAWLEMGKRQAVTVSFQTLTLLNYGTCLTCAIPPLVLLEILLPVILIVWGALALCVVLLLAAVYLPGLARMLQVAIWQSEAECGSWG
jgi:P-type Ca2+ transporter type 2C